jgi:hypothetical protein
LRNLSYFGRMITVVERSVEMGSQINDKNKQVDFLKQRLNMFLDMLDEIDPEDTDLDDIDRMIDMIDDLESKCREFNNRES